MVANAVDHRLASDDDCPCRRANAAEDHHLDKAANGDDHHLDHPSKMVVAETRHDCGSYDPFLAAVEANDDA